MVCGKQTTIFTVTKFDIAYLTFFFYLQLLFFIQLFLIVNLAKHFAGPSDRVCVHSESDLHGPCHAQCSQRGEEEEPGGVRRGWRRTRGGSRRRRRWRRRTRWEKGEGRGKGRRQGKWRSINGSSPSERSAAADLHTEYTDSQHHGGMCGYYFRQVNCGCSFMSANMMM